MKFQLIILWSFLVMHCSLWALGTRGINEITANSLQYQSGDWVKVSGVVDSIYDQTTFRLSDSTGSIQIELCGYEPALKDSVTVIGILDPVIRNSGSTFEVETKVLYNGNELLWESNPERSLPEKYVDSPENRSRYSVKRQHIISGSIFSTFAVGLPVMYGVMKARDKSDNESVDTTHSTSYDHSYTGEIDIDFGMEGIETAAVIAGVTGITIFSVVAITQFVKAAKVPDMELAASAMEIRIVPQVSMDCVGITVTASF